MSSANDDATPPATGADITETVPAISAEDARILDLLAEEGFDPARARSVQDADRARARALNAVLARLEQYPVAPPHESIVDATLARIDAFEADRTEAMRVGSGRRPRVRLSDIVSVAAILLVALGVGVPILSQMRAQSLSTVCANNLRSLNGGLAAYAQQYGGSMPAVAGIGGMFTAPETSPPPAPAASSRRAPLMPNIARPQQWSGQVYVRPGADGRPQSMILVPDWGTYNHSANLAILVAKGFAPEHALRCPGCATGHACFAYKVPAEGVRFQLDTPQRMVVVSDANPVIELRRNGQQIDRSVLSSRNHGEAGQNLLFSDGAVQWSNTPILRDSPAQFVDNIWLPRGEDGRERADLKVRPKDPKDNFVAQ
ncbi:MAG: hypothetical protein U0625_11100 [Phycisphaerales bacterium]